LPSKDMACRDNHGHPLLLFSRLLQFPLPSRDNQVRWHAETIMVIRFCCFQDYYSLLCLFETIKSVGIRRQSWSSAFFFLFLRLLQFLLPSKDNQVRWHAGTIMVICFCYFQDYYNLLCLLEKIKSVGMERQSCLPLFIFSKVIRVSH